MGLCVVGLGVWQVVVIAEVVVVGGGPGLAAWCMFMQGAGERKWERGQVLREDTVVACWARMAAALACDAKRWRKGMGR